MMIRIKRALRMWQRNLDVFKAHFLPVVIGNILEPVLYLFGFGLGIGALLGDVNGLSYLQFIAPGIIAAIVTTTAAMECTFGAYTRMVEQNVYEGILATPMQIEDIVLGEIFWGASKALLSSMAVLLVLSVAGIFREFAVVPLILFNMAALGMCVSTIAICVSAVSKSYEFFNYFITLFLTPMLIFTGIYFPIEKLPGWLMAFLQIFPTTHGVAINRFLFYGGDSMRSVAGTLFLILFIPAGVWVSTKLVKRRLIPR